jgi:transposase
MDENQQKRNYYYHQVASLNYEDFIKSLPNPQLNYGTWGTYEELMELIQKILVESSKEFLTFLEETSLIPQEKEEIREELKKISKKIQHVKQKLEEHKKEQHKEKEFNQEPVLSPNKRTVLFATSSSGAVLVEQDLKWLKKNLDYKTYESYLDLIEKLTTDYQTFNPEKSRNLGPSFKEVFELKDDQARLYYRRLGNIYIIIGALSKKDDWDNRTQTAVGSMVIGSDAFVHNLEKHLQSGGNIQTYIEQNNAIFERIGQTRKGATLS